MLNILQGLLTFERNVLPSDPEVLLLHLHNLLHRLHILRGQPGNFLLLLLDLLRCFDQLV